MKKQITVKIFDQEQYGGSDWPPGDAIKFVEWFTEKVSSIPEDHRKKAKIELDSSNGYEGISYVRIKIHYNREETDLEMMAREEKERYAREETKRRDLAMLSALKAKYER